jgi:hypothetical protein
MSKATRTLLRLILASVTVSASESIVTAAPILDQSFLGGTASVSGNDPFAQTFTVGVAGTLAQVDVRIFGEVDVRLDIRPTAFGVPLASDDPADQLARVTVSPPDFPALVSVNLRPFGIHVQPGDVLAIVLSSQGIQNWGLGLDADATYAGGEAFLKLGVDWETYDEVFPLTTQADFQFQTFVPEPGSTALFVLGVAGLLARRRRSRSLSSTRRFRATARTDATEHEV